MTEAKGIIQANIIDITLEGKGVADQEGKVVFVPFTITGEQVSFQRGRKKKSYDEGKLIEVLHPSAERVSPKCEYFMRCGGCSTQHISEHAQVEFKQKSVIDTLSRIGKVTPENILPPVTDKFWGYRRRARLAVKYVAKKERVLVGFREYGAPYVTDMLSCEVLHPQLACLIEPLSELITQFSIKDKVPQVECSVAENATALVFRILQPLAQQDEALLETFASQHNVRIYIQTKGPATVAPLKSQQFDSALNYSLPPFDITLDFQPIDFIQVHNEVNQKMVQQAMQWLALEASHHVLDLFCGLGNFSLPMAKHASQVLGIEGDDQLVARAQHNAQKNHIENIQFRKEDLFVVSEQCDWLNDSWDIVVIDPTRAGAKEVVERLAKINAEKILYISCHPGTLARDADILVNMLGYRLDKVSILNMFPHTGHVETMALFIK